MKLLKKIVVLSRMVKIEHSIFALPFAYIGLFLAAHGRPGWRPLLVLTLAMVAVRSFAMGFNRLADLPYDRENPRTKDRPLVTGELTTTETRLFLAATGLIFIAACWALNTACLVLSVPALALCAFYSYTKRFTILCHFFLGAVLGLAPVAGWLAFDPTLTMSAALFFLGVTFWVAGFDILYACQDLDFDLDMALHSIPAKLGIETALPLSSFCHVNASIFFLLGGLTAGLGWIYILVWTGISIVLALEHRLISANDMSRVNMAFFTLNGFIALALFAGALADVFL